LDGNASIFYFIKELNMNNLKLLIIISIIFLVLIIIVSFVTEIWVILSLGVGFLFGFAIQKGDLCGASAMSEVLLFKDKNKIFGLWVAIVASMIGFAILQTLNIVELAPKKMIWLSSIVGGLIFGIGTVLGGGCISGCMYKGATGNINSIAAMTTIPVGIALVEYGPLNSFNEYMLTFVVNGEGGKPITLQSLLGIPYWLIVLVIAIATIILGYRFLKKQKAVGVKQKSKRTFSTIFTKSWKPWQAGIAIGIIGVLAWLSSLPTGRNYPLGVTHGVNFAYQMIIEKNVNIVYQKPKAPSSENKAAVAAENKNIHQIAQNPQQSNAADVLPIPPKRKIVLWLVLLVIGYVFGAFVSGKMSGQVNLTRRPPEQTVIAIIGGLLIGAGAAIGTGCVIGNIISGWAMMSIGMFIFGISTLAGNWITTYFYQMGGNFFKK
jgi:uncharacterized protein